MSILFSSPLLVTSSVSSACEIREQGNRSTVPSTKTWQLQMSVGRDEYVKVAIHSRLSFLSHFIGDKKEVNKRNVRIAELAELAV